MDSLPIIAAGAGALGSGRVVAASSVTRPTTQWRRHDDMA